jgi:hypothetical protein
MSFYGNVINPPKFFNAIEVGTEGKTLTIDEAGMVLKLIGDGTISIDKTDINTIQFGQIYSDGLYLQCRDDHTQWFKLTVNSNGVLEIYKVTKEAN